MTRMYALIPTLLAASLAPACGDNSTATSFAGATEAATTTPGDPSSGTDTGEPGTSTAPTTGADASSDTSTGPVDATSTGDPGTGGTTHVAGELLKQRTGLDMTHVPYKGMAPLVQDMGGDNIDFAVLPYATSFRGMADAGRMKLLGWTGIGMTVGCIATGLLLIGLAVAMWFTRALHARNVATT